jgi:hypothetical protein
MSIGADIGTFTPNHLKRLIIIVTGGLFLLGAGALAGIVWRLPDVRAASEFLLTLLIPFTGALTLALMVGFFRCMLAGTARQLLGVWWLWLGLVNGGAAVIIFWAVFTGHHGS